MDENRQEMNEKSQSLLSTGLWVGAGLSLLWLYSVLVKLLTIILVPLGVDPGQPGFLAIAALCMAFSACAIAAAVFYVLDGD